MLKIDALPTVPRWAALAAHAVPLITLPSALWRVALVAGLPVTAETYGGVGEVTYIIMLSVVSEGLALLTLGLVRGWGETVPSWLPGIGGRPVRPLAAVVPALLGAFALFALLGWAFYAPIAGLGDGSVTDSSAQTALLLVCYAPLVAWPPLLTAVTVAYYRRRTASASFVAA